jgi:ABC-type multidrug transport system ATPase subunit
VELIKAGVSERPIADVPHGVERTPIISAENVSKVFRSKGRRIPALAETSLDVGEGEFLTLVGPSGCGKSTLMNLIVGLLTPSTGSLLYRGEPYVGVHPNIGYVTQADNLTPGERSGRMSSFRWRFAAFRGPSGETEYQACCTG